MLLRPAYTYPDQVDTLLRQQGYAVLSPGGVAQWSGCALEDLATLVASWNDLPPDQHLKDGGRYRRRRHASFVIDGERITQAPHRAHWQPLEYNALHGGMQRWFDPVEPQVAEAPPWRCLLQAMARTASALRAPQPWYLEAHQFRIDTAGGIGRPTPEGAHRDGVDLVAVFLVAREGIKGGETRVFQSDGPAGQRFTLTEPWSLLLLDDARVVHETTPIQPEGTAGHRDTLVLTCRAGSFQDE
jgi:hypothetical protein